MKEKVIRYMKKHKMIKENDGILVAVSGGADSICLLHILKSIEKNYKLRLMVIHINHMLRDDADGDEEYVREICKRWDIPFFAHREDIKALSRRKGISIEEGGREVRYNCFYKLRDKYKLEKVALGQHGDDNAETILMRILRGTGPKGLGGIPPHRQDGIIRPLLSCSREEIEAYCRENKLSPRIDKTNLQNIYHRNKIRLEVLPYLEQFNNNLKTNLQNLGDLIREQEDFINKEMDKIFEEGIRIKGKTITIPLNWFLNLDIFVQKEIIRKSIRKIKENLKDIEYSHIQIIIEKLKEKSRTTWELQLPDEVRVERQYEDLIISQGDKETIKPFHYPLIVGQKNFIPEINAELNLHLVSRKDIDIINNNPKKAYLDYDKISGLISVRNRISGDSFRPSGKGGRKKLKDFFIDIKLPRYDRDKVPLIVEKDSIIWVAGYRVDERYIVDEETKNILVIELRHKGGNHSGK